NGPFTDYALNAVSFWGTPNGAAAQLGGRLNRVTLSNITDQNGTSNTVMMGEKSMDTNFYANASSSKWDECIFSGGYGGTNRSLHVLLRDGPDNGGQGNYWGSPFDAGGLFVFCDGQVRIISYSLNGSDAFACALNYRNTVPFSLDD